jgi:hypothetical protein
MADLARQLSLQSTELARHGVAPARLASRRIRGVGAQGE